MLNRESPSATVYWVTPGVPVAAGVVAGVVSGVVSDVAAGVVSDVAAGVPAGVVIMGVAWDGRAVAVAAAVGAMKLGIDSLAFSGGFNRSQSATTVPTRSARRDPLYSA